MAAYFGPPTPQPADHGAPLPWVDPDPTLVWEVPVFQVGDAVTFQDVSGSERKGVVEKIAAATNGYRPRLVVQTACGNYVTVNPNLADRCSLLEVLAEASERSPL